MTKSWVYNCNHAAWVCFLSLWTQIVICTCVKHQKNWVINNNKDIKQGLIIQTSINVIPSRFSIQPSFLQRCLTSYSWPFSLVICLFKRPSVICLLLSNPTSLAQLGTILQVIRYRATKSWLIPMRFWKGFMWPFQRGLLNLLQDAQTFQSKDTKVRPFSCKITFFPLYLKKAFCPKQEKTALS